MEPPRWSSLDQLAPRLEVLPDNHRRVIVALLEVFSRDLRELSRAGAIAAGEAEIRALEQLASRLRGGTRLHNWEAVRVLLEVQLEELEPKRLSAYGELTPEHQAAVGELVSFLRHLLSPPP